MRRRWILEASGFALLLALPYFAQLLFPGNIVLYHHHRLLRHTLSGLLLAMLEIAVLGLSLLAYFHYRFKSTARAIIAAAIAVLVTLRGVDDTLFLIGQWQNNLNQDISANKYASILLTTSSFYWHQWLLRIVLVAAVALLTWKKPSITSGFVKVTRFALAAFAFCLLWIVPLLLYFAYGVRPHPYARPQMHAASDKRIVWILFDELSYKLVFEQPPERMQFPNFDVLRAESVSLGDIHPPGFRTDEIIPSLLLGKKIDAIRSNFSRKLIYLDETSHQWMPYDKNRSLFRLAQSAGWNSGVAGWYNPYCRIFGSLLDACFWEPGEFSKLPLENVGASEDKSALENASILVRVLLLDHVPTREDLFASQVATYSTLMKHAEQLIRNEQLNFVFIHLPLPHPPGYYDRRTHRLCACGNYLDNLVLADDTMGELAKTINQTHEADQTILIISSDHSWRVPIWDTRTYWTPEEQRISQGQYDSRAVFLVHFPGQKSAIDVPGTYSEVAEYDIIASMLQHKTNSPDDLVSFLRRPQPSSQSSQLAQH